MEDNKPNTPDPESLDAAGAAVPEDNVSSPAESDNHAVDEITDPNAHPELAEQRPQLYGGAITPTHLPIVTPDGFGGTRRLPSLESVQERPLQGMQYGYSRDIGLVRTVNQDSIFTFVSSQRNVEDNPDFGLFIVADGAGGHEDGEKASKLASRIIVEQVSRQIYQPMLVQHIKQISRDPLPPINEVLTEAVKAADREVRKHVPGGGTTFTGVVVIGDLAHVVHVGDSRAYLIMQDEDEQYYAEQLTRDHSVAKRLEEIGQITAEEAAHHPETGRLWKIMGLTDNLEPDVSSRRLPGDSYLVLCSDGLWGMVPPEDLLKIVSESASPQDAANRLVVTANGNGGVDNIAVIVVQLP
jgi:serine/threonine protein phosphatase PrpC